MLTPQLLDSFRFYNYIDYKTIQRGQQYFRDGRVYNIEYHNDYAICHVEGTNDDYEVVLSMTGRNNLNLDCTCPQAEVAGICKHMIASIRLNISSGIDWFELDAAVLYGDQEVKLRDIQTLREYRFSYVILDESQAIKNPLSQSAKAARLLSAEQRLCMTGTPVENNTFELWSQFAFINPGLLGSMDYFRREFASPIESKQDEKTADLLRRLVYPFILRRTKEQVAPELPPRTERLIYTDLEPAQRKIYIRTRDYYRAQLLGMIDEGGLDNARMKILEGLLRLRQVCIHPALVEPTYKKESAKFEILLETLETLQAEGHKALVFSQSELDRRRLRDPPGPVVESRRRNAGRRSRPPHRPGQAGFYLQIHRPRNGRRKDPGIANSQEGVGGAVDLLGGQFLQVADQG
jgi:hypothetical protein